MRCSKCPKITEQEIGEWLIEMTVISEKFEKSMKEAEELWTEYKKIEKSNTEYSNENLIDKTITKRILKENEKDPEKEESETGYTQIKGSTSKGKIEEIIKETKNDKETEELKLEDFERKTDRNDTEESSEYESEEENWCKIYVGNNGPYKIKGKGVRFEVILENKSETAINYNEFIKECQERGMENSELDNILDEIRDWIKRNDDTELQNIPENEDEENFENIINTDQNFPRISV
jgi:hypothetical protein